MFGSQRTPQASRWINQLWSYRENVRSLLSGASRPPARIVTLAL